MTDQHPITPSPKLVQQWLSEFYGSPTVPVESNLHIANLAAQWGADRQLEADAEWLEQYSLDAPHLTITPTGKGLVEAMRPKPPSLKEQACKLLECYGTSGVKLTADQCNTIRRALEALPDD